MEYTCRAGITALWGNQSRRQIDAYRSPRDILCSNSQCVFCVGWNKEDISWRLQNHFKLNPILTAQNPFMALNVIMLVAGDMEAGRMKLLPSRNLQASQQDPSDITHAWDGCINSCTGCPPSVCLWEALNTVALETICLGAKFQIRKGLYLSVSCLLIFLHTWDNPRTLYVRILW